MFDNPIELVYNYTYNTKGDTTMAKVLTREEIIEYVEQLVKEEVTTEKIESINLRTLRHMASYLKIKGYSKLNKEYLMYDVRKMLTNIRESDLYALGKDG